MNKDILPLITQTEKLFNEKRYAKIIVLLSVNLLERLKNAALYEWLARAHDELNEKELAFLYANKAISIDAAIPLSYNIRGNVWFDKMEYDKATNEYNKAITLYEKRACAYFKRGNV
jgi:tetratricopeptide (TPR) repeat protein